MHQDNVQRRRLNCYLDTSREKEQKEIQTVKSDTEFKFGDGKSVFSERYVSIPCRIAKKCNCRNRWGEKLIYFVTK